MELERIREEQIRPLLGRVVQVVRKHLEDPSYRLLLFGSWATGSSDVTSDIDVGVLGPAPLDDLVIARIREEIERLPTLRKIEIVDLNRVEPSFRESVQRHAELLT
ncbi:nucleotidyltransferase family protein [Nitrospira sp. Kam-Ns4a]